MRTCRQARILTWSTRAIAVVATGAISWFVAQPIAQQFEVTLSDPMQIAVGAVCALIALFVSKRPLDFTQDCLAVPDEVSHGALGLEVEKVASPNSSAGSKSSLATTPSPRSLNTTVADLDSMKVSVNTTDGATVVTVTISGVTASRFKDKQSGLRKKIESVNGVRWENPKNLGNGTREMVGRVTHVAHREAVVARLQELAASL